MSTKAYRERYPERIAESNRRYRAKNAEAIRAHDAAVRRGPRQEVIDAYRGRCQCCGEERWEFLTIDHINGGGRKHRASLSPVPKDPWRGWWFYRWLKAQGYPKDDYRLLCFNCTCARGHFGYCPHEREQEKAAL